MSPPNIRVKNIPGPKLRFFWGWWHPASSPASIPPQMTHMVHKISAHDSQKGCASSPGNILPHSINSYPKCLLETPAPYSLPTEVSACNSLWTILVIIFLLNYFSHGAEGTLDSGTIGLSIGVLCAVPHSICSINVYRGKEGKKEGREVKEAGRTTNWADSSVQLLWKGLWLVSLEKPPQGDLRSRPQRQFSGCRAVISTALTGRTPENPSFLASLVTYLPGRPVHSSVLATLRQGQPAAPEAGSARGLRASQKLDLAKPCQRPTTFLWGFWKVTLLNLVIINNDQKLSTLVSANCFDPFALLIRWESLQSWVLIQKFQIHSFWKCFLILKILPAADKDYCSWQPWIHPSGFFRPLELDNTDLVCFPHTFANQ